MTDAGRGYYRHTLHTEEQTPSSSEVVVTPTPELSDTDIARQQGFTGNICLFCGGVHLQQAGHCEVCADCGTTTGCS